MKDGCKKHTGKYIPDDCNDCLEAMEESLIPKDMEKALKE